ncbi:MAG TPA: hypothetical protein VGD80_04755 [Kofleriaceae bacterium]
MYREQEFIERCQCDAPATGSCASCGRARCAAHLERGLCNRCMQAIGREMDALGTRRFVTASVVGVTITLATLVAHLTFGIVIAAPVAFATFFRQRAVQRRRLIARMGPALSASKGELPSPAQSFEQPAESEFSRHM